MVKVQQDIQKSVFTDNLSSISELNPVPDNKKHSNLSKLKINQTQSETPDQNELNQKIILYKRNKSSLQANRGKAAIGYNGRELRISKSHRIIGHQKLKHGHKFF